MQAVHGHWEMRELCELLDLRELLDLPELDLLALRELALELRDPKKPLNILFVGLGWFA